MGVGAPAYAPPVPLTAEHRLDSFDCGQPVLDHWLATHALANEGRASRTYVVLPRAGPDASPGRVVAYYTLAAGSVPRAELPSRLRHGLPNPVPVMILGRLAVDRRHAGRGLGSALLNQAFARTLEAATITGLRALLVHAIDDGAVAFYTRYKFIAFPSGGRTLFLPIETIADALEK